MDIIVTHLSSDFDSFAGMIAAKKLYPGARIVLPTAINSNVRKFISLYEEELPGLYEPGKIDFKKVKRAVIIDTRHAGRLGPVQEALYNEDIEIIIYDHHRKTPRDLKANHDYSVESGASTTILAGHIKRKKIDISSLEATLFITGIYEDTGSFTYPGTTYGDLEAASFLMQKGANLPVAMKFLNLSLSRDQHDLLERLIMNCKKIKINDMEVVLSSSSLSHYIEGLSVLTRKLSQIEEVSIVICWVRMKEKTYIVARSDDKNADVSVILKAVGGGGHPQAASGIISDMDFGQIEEKIIDSLRRNIKKPLLAGDIMSHPVRVIKEDSKIEEVDKLLKKYGHSGIPIVDENEKLSGIITRKDIDRAISHGLSHAPVKGFRAQNVVRAAPGSSIDLVQNLMIENGIGRIPIVEKNRIIGIITRKDILRYLYGRTNTEILDFFPARIQDILKVVSAVSKNLKYKTYLVGGIVRDVILEIPNYDIDIVVEGDGIKFGSQLARRLNCRLESHTKFGTAVLVLENGQHIDIASARVEYYKGPAALPVVEYGSIKQDLARRDFTINCIALSLNPGSFGEMLDYFGGREDIKAKRIKVLHKMSFVEDPTRIFRAVRFEKRLGFKMDRQTENLARTTLGMDIVPRLEGVRIRDELVCILDENRPWNAVKRLYSLGALKKIGLNLEVNDRFVMTVKNVLRANNQLRPYLKDAVSQWRLIMILLLEKKSPREIEEWCSLMKIRKKNVSIILDCRKKLRSVSADLKKEIRDNALLYSIVKDIPDELKVIASSRGPVHLRNIKKYLSGLSGIRLDIGGETLKELGYKPSEKFREVLSELFIMKLKGKIKGKEQEIKKARELMEKL